MFKFILTLLLSLHLASTIAYAQTTNNELLKEIKVLIEQNALKIETMSKRFDSTQNLIVYIIIATIIGLALYIGKRKPIEDKEAQIKIKEIIFALRELAENDPKIHKSLKIAGLL
ncbi:MAG: hypothetical protein JJW00_01785 [Sulfurimonas sp.]|nr:hypothetical protein [Sulfurimonas sp.]